MLTRRDILTATLLSLPAATLLSRPAMAGKPPVFASGGVAINGYDPVAYLTMSKPVKGDAAFASDWVGASLLFANAENKTIFDADPDKYAPKYGGYCAYAVSKGATAPTDPTAWTVHEGRLYLNFSVDVRGIWRQDLTGNIARADTNWPGVLEA
ncbi:MAG: YHS domain protein [Silicimonas sp.]|nr:YHS domain protein [Silicimonas sp.]